MTTSLFFQPRSYTVNPNTLLTVTGKPNIAEPELAVSEGIEKKYFRNYYFVLLHQKNMITAARTQCLFVLVASNLVAVADCWLLFACTWMSNGGVCERG